MLRISPLFQGITGDKKCYRKKECHVARPIGKREHWWVQRNENGSEQRKERGGSRAKGDCEGHCLPQTELGICPDLNLSFFHGFGKTFWYLLIHLLHLDHTFSPSSNPADQYLVSHQILSAAKRAIIVICLILFSSPFSPLPLPPLWSKLHHFLPGLLK